MAPAGRPRISKEKRRRVNLMLDDNTYKYLKMVGDGSASMGIYLIVMHSMVKRIHDEVMKQKIPKKAFRKAAKSASNQTGDGK